MTLLRCRYGYTAHMERLMKAQALADPSRYQFMSSKKTVEINPFHPLIADLAARVEKDKEDEGLKGEWCAVLLLLLCGGVG